VCGADLSLLVHLDGLADVWFNRALQCLASGVPGRALEWLAASCAARPTDAASLRSLAKLWGQLGRWEEARDALQRAAAIAPEVPEVERIREAIDAAARIPSPAGNSGPVANDDFALAVVDSQQKNTTKQRRQRKRRK
jgi:tetratricopeptide (TPR) repeat protein